MTESIQIPAAMPGATLGSVTPILQVASLDASLAYYVAQLGFELQWRADTVASVRRDRAALMLSEDDQGHAGTWVWIAVSDADAFYAEVQDRGARLRHPPTNYPWGSRECQVTDLDGHVLRFGADLRPGEPGGDWLDGAGRRWHAQPDGSWRARSECRLRSNESLQQTKARNAIAEA